MLDKQPPFDLDVEEVVLGTLMAEKNAIIDAVGVGINSNYFYKEQHYIISKTILGLFEKNSKIDLITVSSELRANNDLESIGGLMYLVGLTKRVGSGSHIESHINILKDLYKARELIKITSKTESLSYNNPDIQGLVDSTTEELMKLSSNSSIEASTEDIVAETLDRIERAMKGEETGILTGITKVDKTIAGFQKTDSIVVSGRPGSGKTAFVMSNLYYTGIVKQIPSALFSLEMPGFQVANRLMLIDTGIPGYNVKTGRLTSEQVSELKKSGAKIASSPIFIDDKPGINLAYLKSKLLKLKHKYDIQIAYIDYLQLMKGAKSENRNIEIGTITRGIKELAKEINIPIVTLSQLNRGTTTSSDKRPRLTDLKESGSIEEDADMVLMLHRPEYYGIMEDEYGNSTEGKAEVIIAKFRNGESNLSIGVDWVKDIMLFKDSDDGFNINSHIQSMKETHTVPEEPDPLDEEILF